MTSIKGANYDQASAIAAALATSNTTGWVSPDGLEGITAADALPIGILHGLLSIADAVRQAAPTSPAEPAW
jgi:hypothetical protein